MWPTEAQEVRSIQGCPVPEQAGIRMGANEIVAKCTGANCLQSHTAGRAEYDADSWTDAETGRSQHEGRNAVDMSKECCASWSPWLVAPVVYNEAHYFESWQGSHSMAGDQGFWAGTDRQVCAG